MDPQNTPFSAPPTDDSPSIGHVPTTKSHSDPACLAEAAGRTWSTTLQSPVDRQLPIDSNDGVSVSEPVGNILRVPLPRATCGPNSILETTWGGGASSRSWIGLVMAWATWVATWLIARKNTDREAMRGLSGSTSHSPSESAREDPQLALRGEATPMGEVAPWGTSRFNTHYERVVAAVLNRNLSTATDPPSHHESEGGEGREE